MKHQTIAILEKEKADIIAEIDRKIKVLKDKMLKEDTIIIKELGIEVTKPKDWTKPYNQIEVPTGWRKIKVWELFYILDGSKYMDDFLGDYKGKWNYFWCERTDFAKKNNYFSGLGLYWDLDLDSNWNSLVDSNDGGRVCFCRSVK